MQIEPAAPSKPARTSSACPSALSPWLISHLSSLFFSPSPSARLTLTLILTSTYNRRPAPLPHFSQIAKKPGPTAAEKRAIATANMKQSNIGSMFAKK